MKHFFFWDVEIQSDHLILARRPELERVNENKRICQKVDLVIQVGKRVKINESQKKDKYLDHARELRKWNM